MMYIHLDKVLFLKKQQHILVLILFNKGAYLTLVSTDFEIMLKFIPGTNQ